MDDFLTRTTEQLDDKSQISDKTLVELAEALERAMRTAHALFGEYAFRKWRTNDEGKNPINRALFESWGAVLVDYKWEDLEPYQAKIVRLARKKMTTDRVYIDAISASTGDPAKVKHRFEVVQSILTEALR
jgi:hypothetical protein